MKCYLLFNMCKILKFTIKYFMNIFKSTKGENIVNSVRNLNQSTNLVHLLNI